MRLSGDGTPAVVLPAARPRPGAVAVPGDLLLDVLTALAAADTAEEAALAALLPLCRLPGVRAGAVGRAERPGADVVLLASCGYDCATMAAGASLPADAGMPLTECVRTDDVRTAGSGAGPAWVAVPAGPRSALLLSLTGPLPPDDDVARLQRVGAALGGVLARADRGEQERRALLVLEQGLVAGPADGEGLHVLSRPWAPPLSGDVVAQVGDGAGRWVLVADVCGRGRTAAVGADRLRTAFRACAPGAAGPSAVLQRLDRALPCSDESFATALVLRVLPGSVRLATAGHPAPLLVPGGRVPLLPAPPLGLGLDGPWPGTAEAGLALPAGTALLLSTDGLVDRGDEVDLDAVVAALPPGLPPAVLADEVLRACESRGSAEDDVTLAVLTL